VLALDGSISGVHIFRRELAWAVLDMLRDIGSRPMAKLHAALSARRNLTSHVGRRLARCTVVTMLLLKGMEFDHAIVVHTGGPNGFSPNDLYVALTRGSKSLTVLASADAINVGSLPSMAAPSVSNATSARSPRP
jgi:DNA helicase-2/ATP-dependent DNA helicase PcrA